MNEQKLEVLKTNPIFQLSLSSKELFHSNFLYWLATSQTEFFNTLLTNLGIKDFKLDLSKHLVCREYQHFDFCICEKKNETDKYSWKKKSESSENVDEKNPSKDFEISDDSYFPGKVLLVLENKFKSIPTKKQLDEYKEKIEKCDTESGKYGLNAQAMWDFRELGNNKQKFFVNEHEIDKVIYILLTLATEFPGKSKIGEWKIISYDDYANALKTGLDQDKEDCDFSKQIIVSYQKFIKSFSDYISNELNLQQLSWKDMQRPILKELRIQDIWQKLVVSSFVNTLLNDHENDKWIDSTGFSIDDFLSPDYKIGQVFSQLYYGTAGAAINVYVNIGNELIYHIQIQGDQYRRGIYSKNKVAPQLFDNCIISHIKFKKEQTNPFTNHFRNKEDSYYYCYKKMTSDKDNGFVVEPSFDNIREFIENDVNQIQTILTCKKQYKCIVSK